MAIHPFVLLRPRDLDRCLQMGQSALQAWSSGWLGGGSSAIDTHCVPLDEASIPTGAQWRSRQLGNGSSAWIYIDPGVVREVGRLVFRLESEASDCEAHRTSAVGDATAANAVDALIDEVLRQLHGDAGIEGSDSECPTWVFRRGSGFAWLRFGIAGRHLAMLVPHQRIRLPSVPTRAPRPITPLTAALTMVKARVHVELGHMELTIGALNSLAIGDVIRLPTTTDQPLRLMSEGGTSVCAAHLGQVDGLRAVEVVQAH